jgi:hypothetical protein
MLSPYWILVFVLSGIALTFGIVTLFEYLSIGKYDRREAKRQAKKYEHVVCAWCDKVGHKGDMVSTTRHVVTKANNGEKYIISINFPNFLYFHTHCYCKAFNKKPCPCGKGFVDSKK